MIKTSYLNVDELSAVGFQRVGTNVLVSRLASIYGAASISLSDNVRIDDFCILSGKVTLGSHVHVAAYSALFGSEGIVMEDFSGLSARVTIYSSSDDYLGRGLTNPTVPEKYRRLKRGAVSIGRHVIVGASSVILPGVTLGEGSAVGAMSLVSAPVAPWKIASGIPARARGDRRKETIEKFERQFRNEP